MPRKRKLSNLANRCRFCLARDACMSELFVDWIRPKFKDLEKCSSVEILDKPNYPKSICYVCLYKLEMWSEFKSQFLKTNNTLLTHFKVVDQLVTEEIKRPNAELSDELFSDDNKHLKRPRIDAEIVKSPEKMIESFEENVLLVPIEKISSSQVKVVEDSNVELMSPNESDKNRNAVNKIQPSDTSSVTSGRKSGRKKIEREASTKRWVERKNALMAATGEVSSESDSDNSSKLSPVQKARAKSNNEKEMEKQKKKIQKALKNLRTDMTDKYRVDQDVILDEERKTRSRRTNVDEHQASAVSKVIPVKMVKLDKKRANSITEVKKEDEKLEVEKKKDNKEEENKEKNLQVKKVQKDDIQSECKKTADSKDSMEDTAVDSIGSMDDAAINNVDLENVTLENVEVDIDLTQGDKDVPFTPQLVTSEVCLGNATYVITTTLDVPNSSARTSDISLKTNGINIDATSQDGQKIDLMNAVQLQRVQSGSSSFSTKSNSDATGSEVQKCLKIEIEGMEVEALQRIQLELTNYINKDVREKILESSKTKVSNVEVIPTKFKDSYENLNHQLKHIIDKVLRSNYEAEKFTPSSIYNHSKISSEFIKAAAHSPVFQPKVIVPRLNLGHLCKTYSINNLKVLEDVKRKHRIVGPLSRTLGKRRLVLPKKFDGFSLSMKPVYETDEERTSTPTKMLMKKTIKEERAETPTKTLMKKQIDAERANTPTRVLTKKQIDTERADTPTRVLMKKQIDAESADTPIKVLTKKPIEEEKTETPVKLLTKPVPTPLTNVTPVIPAVTPAKTNTELNTTIVKPSNPIIESKNKISKTQISLNEIVNAAVTNNDTMKLVQISTPEIEPEPIEEPIEEPAEEPVEESTPMIEDPVISNPPSPIKPPNAPMMTKPLGGNLLPLPSLANVPPVVTPEPKPPMRKPGPKCAKHKSLETRNSSETLISPATPKQRQRHICGICGKELFSKDEAEAHVKSHKVEGLAPITPVKKPPSSSKTPVQNKAKPKLMRCKRCQAIVEAKNVKTHICNSVKYNCYLCDCTFGAEHLLFAHLDTHPQYKKKNASPVTSAKNSPVKDKQKEKHIVMHHNNISQKSESEPEEDLEEMLAAKEPQGYSCFVCDKVFVDEEQMKDHLQMHCEEVSDEGNEKGFQCAFCGEKFQTEESLETHVGNHLLEDGEEKINMLINMDTRKDKQKRLFKCDQCDESFTSSMHLAMHMPLHEEEAMIAEDEQEHHVCTICDEIFETSDELSEHLDIHNGNSHVCILCEKPFSSIRDLQDHVSTHL